MEPKTYSKINHLSDAGGFNPMEMKKDFEGLKEYVINRLNRELPADLSYHSVDHTLDVLASAIRIGEAEEISPREMGLLRAAVMLHDIGFVVGYADHERLGCELAGEILPRFGYSEEDLSVICGLIMATRVPQQPNTRLQKIICDADLDYLGREDFYTIGDRLFLEFASRGIVTDRESWNCLQIRFLSGHAYFTQTNLNEREQQKKIHLQELLDLDLNCA